MKKRIFFMFVVIYLSVARAEVHGYFIMTAKAQVFGT